MIYAASCCLIGVECFQKHPLDHLDGFHSDAGEDELRHMHFFEMNDSDTMAATHFSYDVTKCSNHRYVRIPKDVHLNCLSVDSISLTFPDIDQAKQLYERLTVGAILTSHHSARCQNSGSGVILEVLEVHFKGLCVTVHGRNRQPSEFFQHAKIEFQTNIVPDMRNSHQCSSTAENDHSVGMLNRSFQKLESMLKASRDTRKEKFSCIEGNCTSIEAVEDLTSGAYSYYRDLEGNKKEDEIRKSSGDLSNEIEATTGSWRVPFPSDIFWEEPLYPRMLCIDCCFYVQPIIRFALHIENYALKSFHCIVEGNTYLALHPHIHIDDTDAFQRFKLLERSFTPVYLCIAGIPYYIKPHFKLSLKLSHKVSAQAKVGLKTGFIGALRFGLAMNGIVPSLVGQMSFQQSPANFNYAPGKSCSKFDGPITYGSAHECALFCAEREGCTTFLYNKSTGQCKFTGTCDERHSTRCDELLFKYSPWEKPEPNPDVQGTLRLMVTSHLVMLVNGIGGPMASINQSLNWNFIRTDMKKFRQTRVNFKVTGAVGGRVELRLGNSCVYEDDFRFKPVLAHTETIWAQNY